jgi:hypothetical protein
MQVAPTHDYFEQCAAAMRADPALTHPVAPKGNPVRLAASIGAQLADHHAGAFRDCIAATVTARFGKTFKPHGGTRKVSLSAPARIFWAARLACHLADNAPRLPRDEIAADVALFFKLALAPSAGAREMLYALCNKHQAHLLIRPDRPNCKFALQFAGSAYRSPMSNAIPIA